MAFAKYGIALLRNTVLLSNVVAMHDKTMCKLYEKVRVAKYWLC